MALLFLRVTQRKINKMRKTAVRMEDSGSYLMVMAIMMLIVIIMKKRCMTHTWMISFHNVGFLCTTSSTAVNLIVLF